MLSSPRPVALASRLGLHSGLLVFRSAALCMFGAAVSAASTLLLASRLCFRSAPVNVLITDLAFLLRIPPSRSHSACFHHYHLSSLKARNRPPPTFQRFALPPSITLATEHLASLCSLDGTTTDGVIRTKPVSNNLQQAFGLSEPFVFHRVSQHGQRAGKTASLRYRYCHGPTKRLYCRRQFYHFSWLFQPLHPGCRYPLHFCACTSAHSVGRCALSFQRRSCLRS